MKTITITVSVDGNEVTRNYDYNAVKDVDTEHDWGAKILDMLDTLEKSDVKEF